MTIYTVKHKETGTETWIDTEEEVASVMLFDTYSHIIGRDPSWGEVANIEGACGALVDGDIPDALAPLADLGFTLVRREPGDR